MQLRRNYTSDKIVKGILFILASISILSVSIMTVFLFATGGPAILKVGVVNFLTGLNWAPNEENPSYGILMFILASVYGTFGAIIIGVPVGLLVAIFIAKLAPNWLANIIRPLVDLLAGIPSVIYGFVGLVVLVPFVAKTFHLAIGTNLLSAVIVLSIMVLPTIVSISEASIRAVPETFTEASLALGVSKEYTIFRVIIPAARSGIMAAIMLGVGRAIGEAMAVMMVSGNVPMLPKLLGPVRFLTTGIVAEMSYAEDFHRSILIGIGLVLFIFIMIINGLFRHFINSKMNSDLRPHQVNSLDESAACLLPAVNVIDVSRKQINDLPMSSDRDSMANRKLYSREEFKKKRFSIFNFTTVALSGSAAVITVTLLLGIIYFIFSNGIPNINLAFFTTEPSFLEETYGILPLIVNTLYIVLLTLLFAVPIGIGSAVYLAEFAKQGHIVKTIRAAIEILAGIPSIVYGLFGMIVFVTFFNLSFSILSGALTLAIMVLPTIIRTTEESLKSVDMNYKEAALSFGVSRFYLIRTILLPCAMPGILVAVILSVGRIFGESAALLFTSSIAFDMPIDWLTHMFNSGATLTVQLYIYATEGSAPIGVAFAIATVIMCMVFIINLIAMIIAKFLKK